MPVPLLPLLAAGARALGVSAGAVRAGTLAATAYRHRGLASAGSTDDPRSIIDSARDPSVDAEEGRFKSDDTPPILVGEAPFIGKEPNGGKSGKSFGSLNT
jgi:hypothetical protein